MLFCLPAPLAGPADDTRSGAAFATSGMTEMSDGRIPGIRDHPEGESSLPPIPPFAVTCEIEERFSLGGAAPRPVRGGSAAGSRAGERKTHWANPPAPQPRPSPCDASREGPWS